MESVQRLLEEIKRVQRRLLLLRVIRYAAIGLLAGSAAALLVLILSRLVPLLYARSIALSLLAAAPFLGAAAGLMRGITPAVAARTMDRSTGDAVGTAIGLLDSDSRIASMQREDAAAAAAAYTASVKEHLPLPQLSKRQPYVYGVIAAWAIIASLWLLPSAMDEKAAAIAEAKQALAELEETAEDMAAKLEAEKLPEKVKQELEEPVKELKERLAKLDDPKEALEALEQAKRELEKLAAEAGEAAKRLDATAAALQKQPQLRKLGEALEQRDASEAKSSIDELRSAMKRLSPQEREALAAALERAAAQTPDESAALSKALEDAAKQARGEGEGEGEGDALAALEQALAGELSQGDAAALAAAMAGQLGGGNQPSGGAIAGAAGSSGSGTPTAGAGSASGSSGEGAGDGAWAGQGSGSQGSGEGAGAGAGGSGGAGGASGSGSGSGSGTGGSGQGAGGQGAGFGNGNRDLVTTPRALAGSGNVQQDGGPTTGGQIETGGKSPMIDGISRPYTEVYAEYATEAKEALSRNQLPQSMQQRVRDYFEEIQPNR